MNKINITLLLSLLQILFLVSSSQNLTIPDYCTTYVQIQSGGMGGGHYVRFYVNNQLKYDGQGDGIHFALFNEEGTEIVETKRFQTGSFGVSGHVRDMADWLNAIPDGRYVIGGINWEAAMYMTIAFGSIDAYNGLKSIGAKSDVQFWLHDAYAIIGKKGATYSDSGIKSLRGPSLFPGEVDIHGCIGGCGENGRYIRAISEGSSKGNKAEIHIDGQRVYNADDKGTMIYVLDKTGEYYSSKTQGKTISNDSMEDFVNGIPNDYTVIVVVKGSSTWGTMSFDFFQSCGARDFSTMLVDQPYALIGKKGMSSGQGISQKEGCCGIGKVDLEYCVQIIPCAPQCGGECSGTPDNCTGSTCQANRINFPTCECPSGTYSFGDLLECQPCAYMCTQCNEYANQCVGACSHSTRDDNTSDCACKVGYYQVNQDIECQQCDYKCKSCENSSENCTECSSNDRDINNGCQCNSDMYEDENGVCQPCNTNCATCETSADNCLSCAGNRINDPTCECPSSTFSLGLEPTCTDCFLGCTECSGSADSCVGDCSHSTRDQNTSNCACKIGFFQVNLDVECQECHFKCGTCETTNENCQTCSSDSTRDSNNNCECLEGYFQVNQELECQQCNYKCQTCETSTENCTQCSSNDRDINNGCQCNSGMYEDENQNCQACAPYCNECSGDANSCVACLGNRVNAPNCDCPASTFAVGQESTCTACGFKCSECSGTPENCSSCSHSTRDENSSECDCKIGFFQQANQEVECQECDYKCSSCENSSTECTQCLNENRDLVNGCVCLIGYFENENLECQKCPAQCVSCDNQSVCTECKTGLERDPETCECLDGLFDDGVNPLCQPCSPQCKTCDALNTCTSCILSFYSPPSCTAFFPAFAVNSDEENLENNKDCNPLCATCSQNNPNECQICRDIPNRQTQSPPTCECIVGFHDEDQSILECKECSEFCETCSNSSTCNTCLPGLNRILNVSNLQCECDIGFKENSRKICQECFQYNEECYFECPESTITDKNKMVCLEEEIVEQSHTSLIFLCGGILLFVLTVSGIFSKLLPNKISIEKRPSKNTPKDVEDYSIESSDDNRVFPDPSQVSQSEISEIY